MKVYLLEQTPTEFLIIVSVLVTGYLIRGEVDTLVKFNEVAFWVSFIPVIFVLMFAFYQGDFTNLLPVLQAKPANYINAIWSTINRFKGIEIIFLLLPFMKKKNKTPKVLVSSLFFVGVFYIFIVILSITMFSTEQVKIMLWPGITMIKSIEIPGTFVERWEGIIMAIWVIFFFTTFVNSYYFSADILKDVLNIEDVKISSLIIVPFIYIIALYPQNVAEVIDLEKNLMPIMFIINIVIIPIVLYFISKFRLKRRSKNIKNKYKHKYVFRSCYIMKSKKYLVIMLILSTICMTGCWDKVEIDQKAFVSILGVDAGKDIGKEKELDKINSKASFTGNKFDKIKVTYDFPDISELGPEKGGTAKENSMSVDAYSMQDSIDKIVNKSSRSLDFGHLKLIVLNTSILDYSNTFKEVIDYLQRQPAINRRVYMVFSEDKSEEILKFKPNMEKSVENYIIGILESNNKNNTAFPLTLNKFLEETSQNNTALIPIIGIDKKNKDLKISKVAVIKNNKNKGIHKYRTSK